MHRHRMKRAGAHCGLWVKSSEKEGSSKHVLVPCTEQLLNEYLWKPTELN